MQFKQLQFVLYVSLTCFFVIIQIKYNFFRLFCQAAALIIHFYTFAIFMHFIQSYTHTFFN